MNYKTLNTKFPLVIGLSHLGKIFSIFWSKKIGNCYVYDFYKKNLDNFNLKNISKVEIGLHNSFKKNKKKIIRLKNKLEIKKFKNIFLSIDSHKKKNGEPNIKEINHYLKKIYKFASPNSNIIIISQLPVGFCDNFKNIKKINLYYFPETVKLGSALSQLLNMKEIVIGSKNNSIPDILRKLKCKINIFDYKLAEIYKSAINLYLFSNITFANFLDNCCRDYGLDYKKIIPLLRQDNRIGKFSYIESSLGVSGGHLERDIYSILNSIKNKKNKNYLNSLLSLNNQRINLLFGEISRLLKLKKYNKIIWLGISYKKDAYSEINNFYFKFLNRFKLKYKIFSYDSFFKNYKNSKNNIIDLKKNRFEKSLVVYNYLSTRDLKILKKKFIKNKIFILDISMSNDLGIFEDHVNYKKIV